MKKLLFLYNPHAGKGGVVAALGRICAAFQAEGYLVTVCATKGAGDATELARTMAPNYDRLVCSGGDGTLSEVIAGLLAADCHIPLGYIPAGTTNDFSKTLRIPARTSQAAALAASGAPRLIDVGRLNERQFVYVAAFGVFTAVSYETPQQIKSIFGHGAYVLEGIRSLSEITTYSMKVAWDGGELEGDFLYGMVSNSVSVGGFRSDLGGHKIVLDDGLLEVTLVKAPASLQEFRAILEALGGKGAKGTDGSVVTFQTTRVSFSCADAVPWTVDGEFGGSHCYAEVAPVCKAVSIVCGKGAPVRGDR